MLLIVILCIILKSTQLFLFMSYRDQFPRKEQVISKEDLDQQLDQFMSHTKQKRDEELNRVIQEHS